MIYIQDKGQQVYIGLTGSNLAYVVLESLLEVRCSSYHWQTVKLEIAKHTQRYENDITVPDFSYTWCSNYAAGEAYNQCQFAT